MNKLELTPIKVYVVGASKEYANWISDHLTDDLKEANLVLLTGGEDVNPAYYKEPANPRTYFSNRDIHEMEIINKAIDLKIPLYGTCRGLQILTVAAGGKLIQHQSNNLGEHLLKYKNFEGKDFNNYSIPNFLKDYSIKFVEKLVGSLYNASLFTSKNISLAKKNTFKSNLTTLSIETLLHNLLLNKLPLLVTSAHHQAAYPYTNLKSENYCITTWTEGMHNTHQDGYCNELEIPEDIEIESLLLPTIQAYGIQGHPEWMLSSYNGANKEFESTLKRIIEDNSLKITSLLSENNTSDIFVTSLLHKAELNYVHNDEKLTKDLVNMLLYLNSYIIFLSGFKCLNSNFKVLSSTKLLTLFEKTFKNCLKFIVYKNFLTSLPSQIKLKDVESYNNCFTILEQNLKIIDEFQLTEKQLDDLEGHIFYNILSENVSANILKKFPLCSLYSGANRGTSIVTTELNYNGTTFKYVEEEQVIEQAVAANDFGNLENFIIDEL